MGVAKFIGSTVYFDDAVIKSRVFSRQDCINAFNQGATFSAAAARATDSGVYVCDRAEATTLRLDARLGNRYVIFNNVDRTGNLTIEGLKGTETFHGDAVQNAVTTNINAAHTKLILTAIADVGDYVILVGTGERFVVETARSARINGVNSAA